MREFFRGWRRKVGCVALLLACLAAAGWVRSRDALLGVDLDLKSFGVAVLAADESVILIIYTFEEPFGWGGFEYGIREGTSFENIVDNVAWAWSFAGLYFGNPSLSDEPGTIICIHLAWIAIPLMALSACCLLRRQPLQTDPPAVSQALDSHSHS